MPRVLFVTDDGPRKQPLKSALAERDVTLVVVGSREVFEDAFCPQRIEVAVADLEGCQADHGTLCRALKGHPALRDVPLVLLVPEAALGRLDVHWGHDDYLTLPVSPTRLAERLGFLLWKLHRAAPKNGFVHGALTVDFERYEVRVKDQPVDLTYKEFELLRFLALHPGKVFTREVLLDKVWGYDFYGGTRTVDVHIRRLRAKLEVGGATYIETVRHVGYRFLGEPA
jgi:DNA-binding response OmpR family regulator